MKKFQYSKMLPLVTGLTFIAVLWYGIHIATSQPMMFDLTIFITAVTTTGGIFATTNIFYLRKSQLENSSRIKADTYRIASEERYKYNEKMIQLKIKYGLCDADINDLELDSPMDEFESEALNSLTNTVNSSVSDAETPVEIQHL